MSVHIPLLNPLEWFASGLCFQAAGHSSYTFMVVEKPLERIRLYLVFVQTPA